jgi:DNA-binding NarL/FixJ family response regulator
MPEASIDRIATAVERATKLMAGILLKDLEDGNQNIKIARLKSCGFKNTEIAEMLGTTANVVNVAVHSLKKKKGGKKKKK